MTFLPGKQVQPAAALLTNIPAPGAPGNLDQYIAQINKGLAGAKYLVGPTAPYATIQAAVNAAIADGASDTAPAVIVVTPGFYTGDINLTNGGIAIVAQAGDSETATCNIFGNITCVDPNRTGSAFPSYYLFGFYILGKVTLTGTASSASCPLFLDSVYLDGSGAGTDTVTNNVTPVGFTNGALYVLDNVTITADAGFVAVKSAVAMDVSLSGITSRVYGISIATGANVFGSGCEIAAPY
jgi:pectin methylesterase-like acyl-CoA thioesterase